MRKSSSSSAWPWQSDAGAVHPALGPDGPAVSRLSPGCLSMTGSPCRPQVRANLAALDLRLTAIDIGGIDAAVPGAGVQGAWYGGIAPIGR